jgi:hypothetical protein
MVSAPIPLSDVVPASVIALIALAVAGVVVWQTIVGATWISAHW